MLAVREYVEVIDHKLYMQLPEDFNYTDVEVIVIPRDENIYSTWTEDEINDIGKIGLCSKSFDEDTEDYSKW